MCSWDNLSNNNNFLTIFVSTEKFYTAYTNAWKTDKYRWLIRTGKIQKTTKLLKRSAA